MTFIFKRLCLSVTVIWMTKLSSHNYPYQLCLTKLFQQRLLLMKQKPDIFFSKKKMACMYSWRHPPPPLCETTELTSSLFFFFLFFFCSCPVSALLCLRTHVTQPLDTPDGFDRRCEAFGRDCEMVGLMFYCVQYNCLTLRGPDRYIPLGNFNN